MRGSATMCAALAALVAMFPSSGSAHKPITSPYTFNEDVFPIVREHCGSCHIPGGVAPMSLLRHEDAVPWGESMRMELIAGHMPPWAVDRAPARFRNVPLLTGRELNVLLTWAAGGTPPGAEDKTPPVVAYERKWPLGPPDVILEPSDAFTMPPDVQEDTHEFTLPTREVAARWLRAVDLLPGTATIVRSATVALKSTASSAPDASETVLAVWVPGDAPVPVDNGAAFRLPAGAELVVKIHYKKTWEYERTAMTDRSAIGLYFAAAAEREIEAVHLAPAGGDLTASSTLTFSRTIDHDLQALAIYPDPALGRTGVRVMAVRPDGRREELIAFHPRPGWARRYWFTEPIALPRGTRIETSISFDDEAALLPPGATPAAAVAPDPTTLQLTLNTVRN